MKKGEILPIFKFPRVFKHSKTDLFQSLYEIYKEPFTRLLNSLHDYITLYSKRQILTLYQKKTT